MNDEQRPNPRLTEDLRFQPKPGGPARYGPTTDKPVRYITVAAKGGEIIGYVWANDEDDAAGWKVRKAGGDEAFNKGARWARKLHDAKARGLRPTEALAEMIDGSDPTASSHVVAGSPTVAARLAVVERLADEH